MGVQLTTKYFSGLEKHKFIEKEKIRNVIVNEGIKFGDIKFYLAFVIRSSDEMIIAFENLMPKLRVLSDVFQGARYILFGEEDENRRKSENGKLL
jgi:phosphatidylinositol glycan class H protein